MTEMSWDQMAQKADRCPSALTNWGWVCAQASYISKIGQLANFFVGLKYILWKIFFFAHTNP